jgi:beta-lactamase regulating signal transducer with metallopeptidase domain
VRPTVATTTPATTIMAPTAISPTVSSAPAVPRTNADEDTAVEPIRPIVAVRSAGIGVIGVITPWADRLCVDHRGGNDRRTDSHFVRILIVLILIVLVVLIVLGDCRCRKRNGQKRCNENQPNAPHKILLVPPQPA